MIEHLEVGTRIEMQRILPEQEGAFRAAGWNTVHRGTGLGGWGEVLVFRILPRRERKIPRE